VYENQERREDDRRISCYILMKS